MSKLRFIFVFIRILLEFHIAVGQEIDIYSLIYLTEKDTVGITINWQLKDSVYFRRLEEAASQYLLKESISLLTCSKLSFSSKEIIIYALQNIEFDKYKYFLENLSLQYCNGNVAEQIMLLAILPYDWNFDVIENYGDIVIRNALRTCLTNSNIGHELRRLINNILSGRALKPTEKI